MKSLLTLFVSFHNTVCLLLGILAAFLLQTVASVLLLPTFLANKRFKIQFLGRIFRLCCILPTVFLNPFWRYKVVKKCPKGYKPTKTILMVNHLSAADPFVIAAATFPWELKYVFKGDLLYIPVAGWALYSSGDVPLFFNKSKGGWGVDKQAVVTLMDRCVKLLEMNIGLVIFPEGTRSSTGGLQPFKDGFFRLASEHGYEILPCVIHNTKSLWNTGMFKMTSGQAYFAFGDPITSTKGKNVESLKLEVHNQMLNLLELCPLYDPVTEKPLTHIAKTRGHGIAG